MDTCIVEKCQINMTDHWSEKVAAVSLEIFDISYWTCAVLMMIFGIPLNVGIINYEWYGGDPQKRSLSNRMMSSYVIAHCIAGVNLHTFAGFMRYLSRQGKSDYETIFITYQLSFLGTPAFMLQKFGSSKPILHAKWLFFYLPIR